MKAFFCHSTSDTEYVIQVAKHLRVSMEKVFYFEDPEQNRGNFISTLNRELASLHVFVAFVGSCWSEWQEKELGSLAKRQPQPEAHVVFIGQSQEQQKRFIEAHSLVTFNLVLEVTTGDEKESFDTAWQILRRLKVP